VRAGEALLVATTDRDARTFADESLRERQSQTVAAARDEKGPSVQFEVH
jgi:hypothetical protein